MLVTALAALALAQEWPQTRAEKTSYLETSRYEDVTAFLDGLTDAGAPVRFQYIGVSAEGRKIPLVTASRPMVTSAAEAHRQGKPVIYIQANIHAGEVEGKEAILSLLRDWCRAKSSVLDKAVFLINPIYNADGNEKFAPQARNRPGQNGPEMVGVRANGQGLDLNRDYIKAESPEMRAALDNVWVKWRPDVMMDLHTTDGTRHGYPLTWSPPLNPNTDPGLYLFARDTMMPAVKKRLEREGLRTFDYGNDETRGKNRGWYSVAADGRYSTNYAGLVNCIGVLSEALVYLPFKDRIEATRSFVTAVVDYTVQNRAKILELKRRADEAYATGKGRRELGTRFDFGVRGVEKVWLEKRPPKTGVPTDLEQVDLTVYDRFVPTRTSRVPAAYVLAPQDKAVASLLARHGVRILETTAEWSGSAAGYSVKTAKQDAQPFQGHRLLALECETRSGPVRLPAGSFVVPCDQPLTVLVHHILDPEGTDGAFAWGFFGDSFAPGTELSLHGCDAVPRVEARPWKGG